MSAEYRLVWLAKLERVLPPGHTVFGETLPSGRGDTPAEALSALNHALDERQHALNRMSDEAKP